MNQSQLKPLNQLSKRFGVKSLVYGPPGMGKTPIMGTAPRAVALITEPGLLSAKNITNVQAWEAFDKSRIDEFFTWLFQSNESRNFDTVCVDSASQIAEIFLKGLLTGTSNSGKKVHGMQAYGEMARQVYDLLEGLYYFPQKHIYLICKQSIDEVGGTMTCRPYFPGKDLNVRVPHLYDEIWHVEKANVPGVNGQVTAFRSWESYGVMARDRSGNLNELEPPNLTEIFKKCMLERSSSYR